MSTPPATQQPYASASLYVGDLSSETSEGQLFEVFKNVGPVASIRVCRDAVTRKSLGYAYVNFHNVADAERAIDQFNFSNIGGKQCRIMWSQRDPAKRKSGTGNIFIKNLDKSITHAALYDTFSAFGKILSCKVEVDANGVSKGYGFVHYETQEDADQAVAKVNGMMIANKIVFVGPFQPKKARGPSAPAHFTNVYFKNVDESITKEKLEEMFGAHGKITSCAIMQNETGESKGFGFVNFKEPEEAQAAVDKLNGTEINGKPIFVGRAQKRQERDEELRHQRDERTSKYQGANVYVKNLDDNVDDEKLKQEFSRFGSITSVKVMSDEKGNSRGFGFVFFTNPEDASRAITEMNGILFGTKPLYASLAQRKDVRHAQLAAMHQQKVNMMQMNLGMMNMRGPNGMPFAGGPPVFYPPMGMPRMNQPYPPQMIPRPPRFTPPGQPGPQGAGAGGNAQGGPRGAPGVAPGGAPNGVGVGQRMGARPRNARPPGAQGGAPSSGRGGRGGQNAQGQVNRSYKYTSTARNQPGENAEAPAQNEADAKQSAGEQLYGLIMAKTDPMLAGKITGMLLESHQVNELFDIARTPSLLDSKIAEAVSVLQAHQGETTA